MHTKKTQTAASAFRAAFPLTLPVMAGYIFLGMTYGILMVTSGFPVYYPILTAVIVYTDRWNFFWFRFCYRRIIRWLVFSRP